MSETEKLFKQGAEARLYIGQYDGKECLIKERFVKKYRHPELDAQITKERTRAESKAISRCAAAGIRVPQIYHIDFDKRKIYMEYFANSVTVKDFIRDKVQTMSDEGDDGSQQEVLTKLCSKIGAVIGKMHANNIIHGDLTSSNILLDPKGEDFQEYDLVFIDFGLSQYSQSLEDKGVDLYVLERALLSTHSDLPDLFEIMMKSYSDVNEKGSKDVIAKFEEVRARGRKRTMVG